MQDSNNKSVADNMSPMTPILLPTTTTSGMSHIQESSFSLEETSKAELSINEFLESESVRTVMLADYLKALGIY